jgi:multicomponent K+:H+ antiporter subunit D
LLDAFQHNRHVLLLLAGSPLLVVFASPVLDYLDATAAQLLSPAGYIEQVMSTVPVANGGRP